MLQTVALCQLIVCMLPSLAGAQFAFPVGPMGSMGGPPLPLGPQAPPSMPHGSIPMPMPMHMPVPLRHPHMPVVVMPYRSKATDYIFKKKKRRRPAYYSDVSTSSDDSTSDSASSSSEFEFRGSNKRWSRRQKKRDVLTPVISYVTRSGRVVYQKKIKKENPSDWLALGNSPQAMAVGSAEMTVRDLKRKYKLKKSRHRH